MRGIIILIFLLIGSINLYGQNKKQQIEILQLKKDSLLNVHQILTQNNFEHNQKIQLRKNEYASKKEFKKKLIIQLNDEFVEKNEELSKLLFEKIKFEDSIQELDFSEIDNQVQIKLSSKKIDSIIYGVYYPIHIIYGKS
jgi:aminopeptidase N